MVELDKILSRPACSGHEAARVLGLTPRTTYAALKRGDIPSTRIGGQHRVPTAWLREVIRGPQPTKAA